ncbi:MAG TPA: hypothetical protein VK826_14070 [Bacteroidia bacterium]|nr:hypothetical protein [Bacteroidia bacterium]
MRRDAVSPWLFKFQFPEGSVTKSNPLRLHGGSLFYALVISILIAMLTCSVLLAEHFSRLSIRRDMVNEELVRNVESGIALLCGAENDFTEEQDVDLFGRGKDSVLLQRKTWGAFDVCIARAHSGNQFNVRIALVGNKPDPADAFALWLADMDRPLSVTGNTQLRGRCYLPRSGVERAYIEGSSYCGTQLVYGPVENSERFIPPCNTLRVNEVEKLFACIATEGDSVISLETLQSLDSVSYSFCGKPLIVSEQRPIRISRQFLSGQICIISSVSIFIEKTVHLQNIILVAPRIEIEAHTEGQFQAIARDSLIVGKEILLRYPTVLALCTGKTSPEFSVLLIDEQTEITGDIFAYTTGDDFRKHATVSIGKDVQVHGSVYSSDLIDLKGTVLGSVTCSKFVLKTNSAVYENYLMNAAIDRSKCPVHFVGSLLCAQKNGIKSVVQWLE